MTNTKTPEVDSIISIYKGDHRIAIGRVLRVLKNAVDIKPIEVNMTIGSWPVRRYFYSDFDWYAV